MKKKRKPSESADIVRSSGDVSRKKKPKQTSQVRGSALEDGTYQHGLQAGIGSSGCGTDRVLHQQDAPSRAPAAAGSNWQALKRKIGADGSGPKKVRPGRPPVPRAFRPMLTLSPSLVRLLNATSPVWLAGTGRQSDA